MANKEIGSDFWDIPIADMDNNVFGNDVSWFVSGRAALTAILEKTQIKKIALPSYCCESMIVPFSKNGIECEFYNVEYNNGAFVCDYDDVSKDCDGIMLMSYFGYATYDSAERCFKTVIRDITHSVFTKKYMDADFYYGSIRKWAGFCGGGFAYGNDKIPQPKQFDEDFYKIKMAAISKKRDYVNGSSAHKDYLQDFAKAENILELCAVTRLSDDDRIAAQALDVKFIKSTRRKNARYLIDELKDYCIIKKMGDNDCPLFVPILVDAKYRNVIRKKLAEIDIYCPIHWDYSPYHKLSSDQKAIYDTELSLVCDQRYDLSDMKRIVRKVKEVISSCSK